jgi:hypothetical protein
VQATATVENALSGVVVLGATGTDVNATVASFTDFDPAELSANYTATINWGDGSTPTTGTVTETSPGTFSVSGKYSYAAVGVYQVSVTLSNSAGSNVTAISLVSVFTDTQFEDIVAGSEESSNVGPNTKTDTLQNGTTTATFQRGSQDTNTVKFGISDYSVNTAGPADFFDIQAGGAMDGDTVTITYTYSGDIIDPKIEFYDPSTGSYEVVKSDSGLANSFVVNPANHTITVIFDNLSTPAVDELTGTVFAVVLHDEEILVGSGGGALGGVTVNIPTPTTTLITTALVALESHGSGGGEDYSAEATFLSNNQLVLAVTPSTETEAAVSRASATTGETSGTAEGDNAEDPYGYWLRLLGEDLFLQWLQLSQATPQAPTPSEEAAPATVTRTGEVEPPAILAAEPTDALTAVFSDIDVMEAPSAFDAMDDMSMFQAATLVPAENSADTFNPQLAVAATLAGLGYAEVSARVRSNSSKASAKAGSDKPRAARGRGRSLGFTELPERT